jgi:hypothetical protein
MHYTKSYAGMTKKQKDAAAVKDARDWLSGQQWVGMAQYGKECREWLQRPRGYRAAKKLLMDWRIALSFAGIQGYPVRALRRHLWK